MKERVGERRGTPRMPAAWPLSARVLGRNLAEEEWRSLDVSSTGLGIQTSAVLERDAVLRLSFRPGAQPPIQAYAFVAWSSQAGQAGLRFIGISETDQERLAGLVEISVQGELLP